MSDSLASFAALFRAVLLLHGKMAPVSKPDCVRATVQLLNLDPTPFERIFQLRSGESLPSDEEAHETFGVYLQEIEKVIEAVDELHNNSAVVHPPVR
jgi:hypothetical protein